MNQNIKNNLFFEDTNSYSIYTADIWENEQKIVFSENCNDQLAIRILINLQEIIELKGECNFHYESYEKGDDSFKNFYSNEMKLFQESQLDFKKLFSIGFFFDSKGNCFSFHTQIEITINDSNFDYWFALFLRKFDNNLFEIDNFLEHQLESSFNQNINKFIKFLKTCLRQYSDILSVKVFQTAQEWLDEKVVENSIKTRKSNKSVESNFVPKHSFKLKDVDDFKEYFVKKANDFSEIIKELREHFVHESTKVQQLKDILSGIEIDPKNRIEWTGSFNELKMFVSILNYDLRKIQPIKNGIWEIACTCFTKNGNEIEVNQLSKAKGSDSKKNLLIAIIEKI
jgi:hypothetical protein